MAGIFELYTDHQSHIRFRLLAADGTVLTASGPFDDKRAAAAAIAEVRECAGTGLIEDCCSAPRALNSAALARPHQHWSQLGSATDNGATSTVSWPKPGLDAELEDIVLNSEDVVDVLANLNGLAETTLLPARQGVACGITLHRLNKPPAHARSGALARSLDKLQDRLGEGPCLTALAEPRTVLASDVGGDARWPRFAESAASHGLRSVLSLPLAVQGQSTAVLSLSANRSHAFSPDDVHDAEAFAAQASRALRLALPVAELNETVQNLYGALAHRTVIDRALGVVMGQSHCDHATAFGILERAASSRNIKLRDVAASIVASVSGETTTHVHFDP